MTEELRYYAISYGLLAVLIGVIAFWPRVRRTLPYAWAVAVAAFYVSLWGFMGWYLWSAYSLGK